MRYKILQNLKHNGVNYEAGSEQEFNEEEAGILLSINALEAISALEPKPEPKMEIVNPEVKEVKPKRKTKK